jgi:hypothetical protein
VAYPNSNTNAATYGDEHPGATHTYQHPDPADGYEYAAASNRNKHPGSPDAYEHAASP